MRLESPTADGGGGEEEEQIATAFHHHLYSCQRPQTPQHYCAPNSSSSFLENEPRSKQMSAEVTLNVGKKSMRLKETVQTQVLSSHP